MESSSTRPRQAAAPRAEGERPTDKELKEQTNKEIAERVSSPPEPPTPTQEEADKYKEGEPAVPPETPPAGETEAQRRAREQRAVQPEPGRAGYTTR